MKIYERVIHFIKHIMFAKSILLFFVARVVGIYHAACGRFLAHLFIKVPMISGHCATASLTLALLTLRILQQISHVFPFLISETN